MHENFGVNTGFSYFSTYEERVPLYTVLRKLNDFMTSSYKKKKNKAMALDAKVFYLTKDHYNKIIDMDYV